MLPTMPTTGSSQLQPKNLPPVNAVIASTASLMAIGEQPCTAEIYQQPYASDADRLVKVNFKWSKQPVHGFARHQERYDREHNGTGEPAKHTYLSCAKAEARVPSLRPPKIVGNGCN